jgi:hypothetical protein
MNSAAPHDHYRSTFNHYLSIYGTLRPEDISRRCALAFDAGKSAFALRVMGAEYLAAFPDFKATPLSGADFCSRYGRLLILKYLCEGRYCAGVGGQIAYEALPWGEVYYRNFRGRCVGRLARAFGGDAGALERVTREHPELRAEKLRQGDAGYTFEFINGLYMTLIVWEGDDEFPPSAQILFSDNFAFAFGAEDVAAAAEFAVEYLSSLKNNISKK